MANDETGWATADDGTGLGAADDAARSQTGAAGADCNLARDASSWPEPAAAAARLRQQRPRPRRGRRRGPLQDRRRRDRSQHRRRRVWAAQFARFPSLEHVITDAGTGLAKGLALCHESRLQPLEHTLDAKSRIGRAWVSDSFTTPPAAGIPL